MGKWPWFVAGGVGLGLGVFALIETFGGEESMIEPRGDVDEENAMTTSSLLSWPCTGRVASPYGIRVNPITKQPGQMHNGIDIGVPAGTIVRAPADGVVKQVWEDLKYGGGYSLFMQHTGNLSEYATGYAHLRQWLVTAGAVVKRGDPIAISGGRKGEPGAGSSTGDHLHFTVRKNGTTVDPLGELEAAAPSIV